MSKKSAAMKPMLRLINNDSVITMLWNCAVSGFARMVKTIMTAIGVDNLDWRAWDKKTHAATKSVH